MNNDEIECLIDFEYNDNYYVLKSSNLNLLDKNIQINGKIKILDNKMYYENKLIHRLDGPAIEYSDGDNSWLKNGLRHREDGPAIDWLFQEKEYWIDGERLNEKQYKKFLIQKEHKDLKNDLISKNKGKKIKI